MLKKYRVIMGYLDIHVYNHFTRQYICIQELVSLQRQVLVTLEASQASGLKETGRKNMVCMLLFLLLTIIWSTPLYIVYTHLVVCVIFYSMSYFLPFAAALANDQSLVQLIIDNVRIHCQYLSVCSAQFFDKYYDISQCTHNWT